MSLSVFQGTKRHYDLETKTSRANEPPRTKLAARSKAENRQTSKRKNWSYNTFVESPKERQSSSCRLYRKGRLDLPQAKTTRGRDMVFL